MMQEPASETIRDFKDALLTLNGNRVTDIVLIGSVARGTQLAGSDLDLLVVSNSPAVRVPARGVLHVQYFTESEFIQRLKAGDDFTAWCIKFGIPIADSGLWSRIISENSPSPDWRVKLPHAARRLHLASSTLRLGDADAATEEALYALTHVARAVLLKAGEFPLSRPEMLMQLRSAGYEALAALLQRFLFEPTDIRDIRLAIAYVKKVLVHLDHDWYAADVAQRRDVAAQKARRRAAIASAN